MPPRPSTPPSSQDLPARAATASRSARLPAWLPLWVLLVGLLASAALAWVVHQQQQLERRAQFDLLTQRMVQATEQRLGSSAVALRALAASLASSQHSADGQALATHAGQLVANGDFSGLTALGQATRVDLAALSPGAFKLRWSSAPHAGLPADGQALPPHLRQELQRAVHSGAAVLAAGLPGHADREPSLLMLKALYAPGAPLDSDAQRAQACTGLLLASINIERALARVVNAAEQRVDIELYDGSQVSTGALLYNDDRHINTLGDAGHQATLQRSFVAQRALQVASRDMTLRARTTPAFDTQHGWLRLPLAVLATGGMLSILGAVLAQLLTRGRERARELARTMTADLERLAQVVRHTTHAVVIIDNTRAIQWANPTFERLARRPLAKMQGLRLRELGILARGQREAVQGMVQAQDEGRAHQFQLGLIDTDDSTRWLDVDMQPRLNEAGQVSGFLIVGTDITAQRSALQSLAHQRAQMQALIAGANCGVLLWHLPSDTLQLDQRMAQLLGYDAHTLAGMTRQSWAALMHPADIADARHVTRELLAGRRAESVQDLRVRHQLGHWVWMQVRASIIERQANGRVVWLSAIYLDITERKLADERWRLRGQLSSDWYWQSDRQHAIVDVSGGEGAHLARLGDQAHGLRRDQLPWLDAPEGGWDAFHAMLDRQQPFKGVSYRSRSPDMDHWIEIDGQPLFDDDGAFIGYAGVGRNITERLRVTQQLRESLAVLDALFSSMSVPVLMKDTDGVLTRVNPAFEHMMGLPAERLLGHHTGEFVDAAANARHMAEDQAIIRQRRATQYESRQLLHDGRVVETLVYKAPLIDAAGRVLGVAGTVLDITERRQAEQALEHERARLADIIAGASAGVAEWTLAGGEVSLDERFADMLGLRWPDEVPRNVRQWRARVHEADLQPMDEALYAHLRGKAEYVAVDLRMRHADGRWLWVHLRGRVTARDARGRALRITGAHFDVTERRQIAERWRARAELSGDWFWQTDTEHRFIDLVSGDNFRALARGADVVGLRRDQMDWIAPPEQGWAAFHAMLDRHEPFKGVVYLNHTFADDPRWIEIDGRPRWDEAGRFVGYDGVGRDVTERRRVTEQLRQSLARLDSLIRAVPIPLVMKDRHGRNTAVNRAYCEFYGVTEEQVLGRTVYDFWSPEVAARYDAEDQALMADRRTRRSPVQVRASTGQLLDIVVHKSPIVAPDGEVIGTVGAVVDMSEQHAAARALLEAKEAAESANRAKSAFLATMSHEIRTPMNGVIGMAELLSHTELAEHQAGQVQTIVNSARALLDILDEILDFSKIEAGRLELEQQALDVASLVESACDTLLPLAVGAQVALHVHVDTSVPRQLMGDATRLRQIVTNLVSNAIKFSAPAATGLVAVRVLHDGEQLLLTVQDNGIGIDAPTLARLFVPFSQGEISTTRRFGGTGLGLAITQRLVDVMRGHIEVRSQPGEGASFSVRLPLPLAPPSLSTQPPPLPAALHGVRCVLLDDGEFAYEDVLKDVLSWLRDAGANVRLVAPSEALPHDAIVLRSQAGYAKYLLTLQPTAPDADASPEAVAAVPLQLLLGRGRRTEVRLLAPQLALVDQPRRGSLQRAVAVLAGLASPSAPPVAAVASKPTSEPRQAAAGALAQAVAAAPSQHLILVAEDDATNRLVIERQLALLGYRAEMAHDGEQALRLWQSSWQAGQPGCRYAALLTDLHMPGMDGYTVALEIRAAESRAAGPTRRMPILALTANALKGEALRARAAGIDDYLTKPVPLQLLRSTLQHWLPLEAAAKPPEPATSMPQGSWLDLSVPMDLLGQDEAALQELLHDFAQLANHHADAIRQGLAQRDGASAAAAAHRLKSAARALGAQRLAEQCEAVERARTERDTARLARTLMDFEQAFTHTQHAVSGALKSSCPSGTASSPSTSIAG